MFCPRCGTEAAGAAPALFCHRCGTSLTGDGPVAAGLGGSTPPLPAAWAAAGVPSTPATTWPDPTVSGAGRSSGSVAAPGPVPGGGAVPGPGAGRPERSRLGRSLGGVGLVLVMVIGVFMVQGIRGTSAGASSPDDLVEQLEAAMTNTDPAAALALIDPAEIPQLGAFYETAVEQAAAGADVDVPAVLDALTLTVEGVEFHVEYLDDDHSFAKVVFDAGRVSYATHPDRLPPEVRERFGGEGASEPERGSGEMDQLQVTTGDGRTIDPFLVLVKDDGRWYVSLTMTAGQYAVEWAGLPGGNFETYPAPGDPASSPEDAVRTLLDASIEAANTGSYDGAPLDGLFPDAQTRASRIYGDAIAAAMERSGNGVVDDGFVFDGLEAECQGCGITYSDLEVATRTDGALTYAVVESLTIEATVPERCSGSFGDVPGPDCGTVTGTIAWDGSCVTFDTESATDWFAEGPDSACMDDELGESGLSLADFGITDVHVVVAQERGGWVLDPVATVMDYGRTALSHLSDPKVKAVLDD